jgi:hypothetical protein
MNATFRPVSALAAAAAALVLAAAGCKGGAPPPSGTAAAGRTPPPAAAALSPSARFEDIARRAGIDFKHTNGEEPGKFYFIESTPAGAALFDYDNDGFVDVFLVQSGSSAAPGETGTAATAARRPFCALYRNRGDGTFANVTAGSGFDRDLGYGHGVAVGDYDNDGFDDVFVTSFGGNHLFRNENGSGRFRDVTAAVGLDRRHSTGYATSAAFGDYDNDGRLDLYVCYYCPWTWKINKPCFNAEKQPDYCTPELYDPDVHQLFRNENGTRFVDVSAKAGITKTRGRGLAVAFLDYNDDGRQDIFVANDITPNMLWRNNGDGTFKDVAAEAGCAYSEGGGMMAAMGIALADYDRSGRESLFVTNFSNLPKTLFRNVGGGLFEDVSAASGVSLPQMKSLSFGCEFADVDADTWPDLLVANGHVQKSAESAFENVTYRQPKQFLRNAGDGTFREITDDVGDLAAPKVARGLAVGDVDNDGRVDALYTNQNDAPQLLRNRDRSGNRWVSFKTVGTKSNRGGLHTRFTLRAAAGAAPQVATVRAGSSYLSHSDRRVYFGLGNRDRIGRVEIRWPSGTRDVLKDVPAGAIYTVTEGRGITGKQAAGPKPAARQQQQAWR